jgi:small-conductance mechanosensitive channel
MATTGIEILITAKDKFSATFQRARGSIIETENRTREVNTVMGRWSNTVSKLGERLKLLGLIGLGTMAALFVKSPFVSAGFALIKQALEDLFLTITGSETLKRMQEISKWIRDFSKSLKDNKPLLDFIRNVTALTIGIAALGVVFAALRVIILPLGSLLGTIGGALASILGVGTLLGTVLLGLFVVGALINYKETIGDLKETFRGLFDIVMGFVERDPSKVWRGLKETLHGLVSFVTDSVL